MFGYVMRTFFTPGRGLVTFLLVPFAVTAMVIAACSSETPDDTCQTAPAEEIVAKSQIAMANVESFNFKLTHPEGATSVGGGLTVRNAEGSVIGSERMQLEAEADLGRLFVRVDAIVIQGETWMTNPITGNWNRLAPNDSPFGFLDPPVLVSNILGDVSDACYFESDQSDDEVVITANVVSEVMAPLVGVVQEGSTLEVRLTFDRQTSTLTSARISGILQVEDEVDFVRLIELSDFDSEIVIEPPL